MYGVRVEHTTPTLSSNKFMNSFSDHLLLSVSFLCISCLFMETEHIVIFYDLALHALLSDMTLNLYNYWTGDPLTSGWGFSVMQQIVDLTYVHVDILNY